MHGQLFTSDFLREGIRETVGWNAAEAPFIDFRRRVVEVFSAVSADTELNEAQTEDDVIAPVLKALGWDDYTRQQTANRSGREDVPDFLLFPSADARRTAMAGRGADRRYRHGKLIVEAKRWRRALDRGDATDHMDPGTPSSQMLRYLSRVEVASDRAIQWGILTNGAVWRLYWQSARSRSEEFLEFDLAALAGVAGVNADLFAPANADQVHYLRAFFLLFRREAFLPQPGHADGRSFHAIALDAGRHWESKVSADLGQRVFDELFPRLAAAIARHDPAAPHPTTREYLDGVHRAALILLYRLLFVLYAEDRNLLPVMDKRYDDYSLRWLRDDIARRVDAGDVFSASATRAWQHLRGLFRAIDQGDDSIGLPPYNGGLFHEAPDDILARTELPDAELAPLVDGLSRKPDISGRGLLHHGMINYRDLAVQHLGSIYERLLEQRLVEDAHGNVVVQPSVFARKNSGSYYTHDDLVKLILNKTLGPLASERIARFDKALAETQHRRTRLAPEQITRSLTEADAAAALLNLRVCDPAMGSGHFLVSLVDDLADRVLEQLAEAAAKSNAAGITHYQSPIARDIVSLRERILSNARQGKWTVDANLLDDRHLVRRMILKRVVHGVDKNPMAVELAKLALWLHTFTVGAPLSFLDHHLRCGDSLYGEHVGAVRREIGRHGDLLAESQLTGMVTAAEGMLELGRIADVDLTEVERSRSIAADVFAHLAGIQRVLDFWQALRWIAPLDIPTRRYGEKQLAALELISGQYGNDLIALLAPGRSQWGDPATDARVNGLLDECRALAAREHFLHWELAFPGVWKHADSLEPQGGFDAVIGNPPWDRMKLQEVEWFAERKPGIALQARASDRKRMIADLQRSNDPLAADYALAAQRAEDAARIARDCGEYPLLSSGDINLYSLFVERASHVVRPDGIVGLLTPSGIAADKGAAKFFRSIATTGRLAALFDFENRKKLFPDVDSRFKFCALMFAGVRRTFEHSRCAFYLHAVAELHAPEQPDDLEDRHSRAGGNPVTFHQNTKTLDSGSPLRGVRNDDMRGSGLRGHMRHLAATRVIELSADDFRAVNPNTGTAPIFRNALDAALTTRIYRTHPVLVRHEFDVLRDPVTNKIETGPDGQPLPDPDRVTGAAWLYPVRYCTMFHMTNDSGLFHTQAELQAGGWYPVALGRWKKGDAEMLPLYEGKMVQLYDHRAAGVAVNPENLHRPAQPFTTTEQQHRDPGYAPPPQFFVHAESVRAQLQTQWVLGFKHVSAPTNVRTMIAAICPLAGFGNSLPLFAHDSGEAAIAVPLLLANLNALAMDYVLRQKLQGQNLNLFIVEQLPLIAPDAYTQPLGNTTIGDFVRGEVLRLSYTANDLAAFAHDLGYDGPPFAWDEEDRRHRMARLDALYFNLYGLSREEAAYVLDTFPIVREQDEASWNRYRTRELVLGYMNALAAGDTATVLAL